MELPWSHGVLNVFECVLLRDLSFPKALNYVSLFWAIE